MIWDCSRVIVQLKRGMIYDISQIYICNVHEEERTHGSQISCGRLYLKYALFFMKNTFFSCLKNHTGNFNSVKLLLGNMLRGGHVANDTFRANQTIQPDTLVPSLCIILISHHLNRDLSFRREGRDTQEITTSQAWRWESIETNLATHHEK